MSATSRDHLPSTRGLPTTLVTVPNGDGWVHKSVVMVTLGLMRVPGVTIMFPTWRPYEHNLNRCAKEVLDRGFDYWLSIDTDNPPTGNPLVHLDRDFDLVGFPTPVYHDAVKGDRPWYFNALNYDRAEQAWRPHEPCVGLQQVDAIGTGCFLLSRRVLERIEPPWFMREYDAWGIVQRGHDYLFSQKVRDSGMRVEADFDCICRHYVETDLLSAVQAFAEARR